jgi:Ca2+-binding RTX toxin-like protein
MSIITGTEANDTLYGETTTDLIEGLGGNDYIRDEGGDNDIIRRRRSDRRHGVLSRLGLQLAGRRRRRRRPA